MTLFFAIYLIVASLLPFSHCHAIEESHQAVLFVHHDGGHSHGHASGHSHEESHQQGHTCCSPVPVESDQGHHHFLAEYFHYSSDRKKLFVAPPTATDQSALLGASANPLQPENLFSLQGSRGPLKAVSARCSKRFSGISPPIVTFIG